MLEFVRGARGRPEVQRIALIGSLATTKSEPKDVDVLVTVVGHEHLARLADLGRKLKGAAQQHNCGADIFLCTSRHQYLGRTCSYRECRPRVACAGRNCKAGSYLKDDLHIVKLATELMRQPPIELWPDVRAHIEPPRDVRTLLLDPLSVESP